MTHRNVFVAFGYISGGEIRWLFPSLWLHWRHISVATLKGNHPHLLLAVTPAGVWSLTDGRFYL